MDTVVSVGLSHQTALMRRMDVLANNIANASTTAFKAGRVVFGDYLFTMQGDAPASLRQVHMVLDHGVVPDFREGSIETTNNPLDLAIQGSGFLVVETEGGERLYTRAGVLTRNERGELVTPSGARVLNDADRPIVIDATDINIEITEDGRIRSEMGEIAQLKLVDFADHQKLERHGERLFSTDQPELPAPAGTRLIQGALEGSNVNAIEEITEMINVLRSYQSMERSLKSYSDLRDRAVERLSRVQA